MKGRYCPERAVDDIQTLLCDPGHECRLANIVADPTETDTDANALSDGVYRGKLCTSGYYCSGPLIHKQLCPDGFISQAEGLSICTACPVGYYCNKDNTTPQTCIENSECDLSTGFQPICPTGMYKYADAAGTESCQVCPETFYCRAGIQVDQCVAGYLCDEGLNTVPNPSIGQCPEGFYCPKGSLAAVRCPFETMSV